MIKDPLLACNYQIPETGVSFQTNNERLQWLFDQGEAFCKENVKQFNDYKVLIEGAKYNGVWLETQPMGGEMYAKRDVEIALNNILIFLRYQRRDGKLPGMIAQPDEIMGVVPYYDWMQGCFLPDAAMKLYYLIGKDTEYLKTLYGALEDFDNFLWKYRDSNGDGCLECWSIWDTGEDNCTIHMLNGMQMLEHGGWGGSMPPEGYGNMPYQSPQYMSYSYACRRVLAEIAEILGGNLAGAEHAEAAVCQEQSEALEWQARAAEWRAKARQVQNRSAEYLWDENKKAMFPRDKDGEMIYSLTQENIKCMYAGLFTQDMADTFIKEHLLNPAEFWTPYPLPSIAANDPYFHVNEEYSNCAEALKASGNAGHDINDNSWSGPLAGLTYQRSIAAMLNYGHHGETLLIGKKVLELVAQAGAFVQNYNPFTGSFTPQSMNGYGPTVLSVLEYISLLYGVNVAKERVLWTAAGENFEYTQKLGDKEYTLQNCDGTMTALCNGNRVFACTDNVRIETDMEGRIQAIYGIAEQKEHLVLQYEGLVLEADIKPNEEWQIREDALVKIKEIPFDYTAV